MAEAGGAMSFFFAQANANMKVNRVLVEEAVDIAQELYVGITQDRARQRDVLIVSTGLAAYAW